MTSVDQVDEENESDKSQQDDLSLSIIEIEQDDVIEVGCLKDDQELCDSRDCNDDGMLPRNVSAASPCFAAQIQNIIATNDFEAGAGAKPEDFLNRSELLVFDGS